jgi:hypothetical protein
MALESGTYINSLNASNPASTDGLGQADDHLRLIKGAIKNTLPNITGAISANQAELNVLDGTTVTTAELNKLDGLTATTAELNYTDGVTSNIQTQLNSKAPSASPTLTGTTTVSTVSIGGFTIVESSNRLDFRVGATVMMSLDTSGNLRVRGDVSGFDTTA